MIDVVLVDSLVVSAHTILLVTVETKISMKSEPIGRAKVFISICRPLEAFASDLMVVSEF